MLLLFQKYHHFGACLQWATKRDLYRIESEDSRKQVVPLSAVLPPMDGRRSEKKLVRQVSSKYV